MAQAPLLSTCQDKKKGQNVPWEMLQHVSGQEKGAKRALGDAGGRSLHSQVLQQQFEGNHGADFGIGEGVVVVAEVVAAGGGHGVELVIG